MKRQANSGKSFRRRPRFSLKSLILACSLTAAIAGLIGRSWLLEHKAYENALSVTDNQRYRVGVSSGSVVYLSLRDLDCVRDRLRQLPAKAPNVQVLDVTNTGITDEDIEFLKRLSHLRALHVCDTRVTAKGLIKLKCLAHLENLYVSSGQLSRVSKEELERTEPQWSVVEDYRFETSAAGLEGSP